MDCISGKGWRIKTTPLGLINDVFNHKPRLRQKFEKLRITHFCCFKSDSITWVWQKPMWISIIANSQTKMLGTVVYYSSVCDCSYFHFKIGGKIWLKDLICFGCGATFNSVSYSNDVLTFSQGFYIYILCSRWIHNGSVENDNSRL